MIGKGAREIRPATLAEVNKILNDRQGRGGGEFGFEQQTALDYAKRFSHLKLSDAEGMMKELVEIGMKPDAAAKTVDILPNKSQLMLILAKDKIELSEKKLGEVVELVAKYSKKAKKFEPKAVEAAPAIPAEKPAEANVPSDEKKAPEAEPEKKEKAG